MFKKISHISLALLLLVSTMGLAVSKHYCGGRLVSVSVFHQAEPCCNTPGCCHNENSFFKVKDDFSASQISGIPALAVISLYSQSNTEEIKCILQEDFTTPFRCTDSPPPLPLLTTLSLKQVYLL